MEERILGFRDKKELIGGIVFCVFHDLPFGLGELCLDKLEACLAGLC